MQLSPPPHVGDLAQAINNQTLILEVLANAIVNKRPREQTMNDKLTAFLRTKPPTFAGSSNPLEADDWLRVIQRNLEPLECKDWDKLMFWCILWCLSSFGIVSLPHETWCKLDWSGAISEKSSCHEVVSEFFVTNAPSLAHRTVNSCFGVIYSFWVHFGSFHYCTKNGANCWTGAVSAKVCTMKLWWNFSQWTHPVQSIGP